MTLTFAQYIETVVKRYNLHQKIDGTTAILMVTTPSAVPMLVVYDLVHTHKRPTVTSGTFAVPISKEGRARFFDFVLKFNWGAFTPLRVGLKPMNAEGSVFTLYWYVPFAKMSEDEWDRCMRFFEELAVSAVQGANQVTQEWIRFLH
jgi:hypothetical protein